MNLPIILLHGAGGNRHSLGPLLDALPEPRVALELPGRLDTPGTAPETVSDAADWVAERLSHTDRYVLVGHSYGGGIAIELALRHEPGLAGLVLLGTGARLRVHPIILEVVEASAARGEHPPPSPALWRPDTDPGFRDELETLFRLTPPESAVVDWRAANAFDRLSDVETITVPTLVMSGAADVLTPPKYGAYLAERIPGARHVVLPEAGHLFPIERAAEVARAIDEHRAKLGERRVP